LADCTLAWQIQFHVHFLALYTLMMLQKYTDGVCLRVANLISPTILY